MDANTEKTKELMDKNQKYAAKKSERIVKDYVTKWQEETLYVKGLIGGESQFANIGAFLKAAWHEIYQNKNQCAERQDT